MSRQTMGVRYSPRGLLLKFGWILSPLALLLAVNLIVDRTITGMREGDARMINLAGQGRYRAYEQVVLASRFLHEVEAREALRPAIRSKLLELEEIFTELQEGSARFDLAGMPPPDVRDNLASLSRAYRETFQVPLNQFLVEPSPSRQELEGMLRALDAAAPAFVTSMDRVVSSLVAESSRKIDNLRLFRLLLQGLLIVAVAATALLLFALIRRPIRALSAAAGQMAAGDLATRVTLHGRDDLAELGEAFNQMASRLQESYATLEQQVADRTRELEEANEKLQLQQVELEAQQEDLLLANKEIEAFSYSVSHDLRAPLRAIDGFSQILLEDYAGNVDAQGQEHLRRLRGASQRMGMLIDDLLKLSRVTRAELVHEEVDLSALAREIADALRRREPDRAVQLSISPGLRVRADQSLLRIVLENLLGNAWKFTGQRDEARIAFGATERDGKPVYFVRDNGAGFDMAYADKLFGAFQRLHGTSEFPGTGIGLATVQRIVHKHGGQVWAEGAVGEGATFYFTL